MLQVEGTFSLAGASESMLRWYGPLNPGDSEKPSNSPNVCMCALSVVSDSL